MAFLTGFSLAVTLALSMFAMMAWHDGDSGESTIALAFALVFSIAAFVFRGFIK